MNELAVVEFYDYEKGRCVDLEVPLDITANDLIQGLNEAYSLEMNTNDIFNCYMAAENPIAFLRGNKTLAEFGVRNGTRIIYRR